MPDQSLTLILVDLSSIGPEVAERVRACEAYGMEHEKNSPASLKIKGEKPEQWSFSTLSH